MADKLRIQASWRGRAGVEGSRFADSQSGEPYLLHRLRISIAGEPARWLGFEAEMQDSRGWSGSAESPFKTMRDPLDVRHASVRFGVAESPGWRLNLGRQDLSIGDERLIGSDSEWCNLGRVFDLASVTASGARWSTQMFAGTVVNPWDRRLNAPLRGDKLAGITGSFELAEGQVKLSPHWLVTSMAQADGGRRNIATPGVSWDVLIRQTHLTGEANLQHGWGTRASAFAVSYAIPLRAEPTPIELSTGYSRASGGGIDRQGRQRTFHDLYPAGHNGCGLLDPYAWRNLQDASGGVAWQFRPKWSLTFEGHLYWLASAQDGLYVDGGDPLYFTNASLHAGRQLNWLVQRTVGRRAVLSTGFAWLATGRFVQQSGGPSQATVLFVSWDQRI